MQVQSCPFLIGAVTIVLCKCKCKFVPLATVLNGANPEEEALMELTADCIDDCCVWPCITPVRYSVITGELAQSLERMCVIISQLMYRYIKIRT